VNCRLIVVSLTGVSCAGATIDPDRFGGPTELQDTFLPSQLRYQSYPEHARILKKGDWRVTVEEDWTAHLAKTDTYLFDGESLTSTLKLRHSPWKSWELGLDLPYTARLDGAADEFIEFVELTLNAPVPARYELPRDTYNAVLETPNRRVLTFPKSNGLNDLTLRLKKGLTQVEEFWLDAAVVWTLSLPTGEQTFGGEGVSPGLGLHLQKPITHWLNTYAGAAGVYYSDREEQHWQFNRWRGMTYAGTMWKPADWVGFLVMYQIYTPFTSGNPPLNDLAHYYSVTGRFWLNHYTTFEAGVVENLGLIENRNSSDVTFKFALTFHF
jgi:hypothetical protein